MIAAGSVFGQQRSALSRTADLRAIERLEVEWNRANEVSDVESKRRLLAEDSYHVGPSGRLYTKQQDIEATELAYRQKRAPTAVLKFSVENQKIRLHKNVAVVTATGWSVTTKDGKERRGGSFRSLHVWEKRAGRWQLVVDQVTGVAN
jgi:ketosteroid isomerase-like protein